MFVYGGLLGHFTFILIIFFVKHFMLTFSCVSLIDCWFLGLLKIDNTTPDFLMNHSLIFSDNSPWSPWTSILTSPSTWPSPGWSHGSSPSPSLQEQTMHFSWRVSHGKVSNSRNSVNREKLLTFYRSKTATRHEYSITCRTLFYATGLSHVSSNI